MKRLDLTNDQTFPRVSGTSSTRRRALLISVLLHAVLGVALLSWYIPVREPTESVAALPAAADDITADETAEDMTEEVEPQDPALPSPPVEVSPKRLEKSVESHIRQFDKLTEEQKLTELEKNLQRLKSISDSESVHEVTTTIASALGVDQQQYAVPDVPPEGAFDIKTAQLQDVVRLQTESGDWKYESVMVDSAGRMMMVPMNTAEGETVYNTFEQMKKYPLAAGIYRGVVMPLIQKMIEAEQLAKQTSAAAARTRREAHADESGSQEAETLRGDFFSDE